MPRVSTPSPSRPQPFVATLLPQRPPALARRPERSEAKSRVLFSSTAAKEVPPLRLAEKEGLGSGRDDEGVKTHRAPNQSTFPAMSQFANVRFCRTLAAARGTGGSPGPSPGWG